MDQNDRLAEMTPAIAFVGRSGSGKTTLIELLIPELAKKGLKVGTIKHDAHEFEIDKPGKDSYRHKHAGASTTIITSGTKLAMIKDIEAVWPLRDLIERYYSDVDIVIVEGFKKDLIPKIEVIRQVEQRELIFSRDELFAIATDMPEFIESDLQGSCRVLDINDISAIAELLSDSLKTSSLSLGDKV